MAEVRAPAIVRSPTVPEAGQHFIEHVRMRGRKKSTIEDYEIIINRHLAPHFGTKSLDRITTGDVESLMAQKVRAGLAHSTVAHIVNVLSGICRLGVKRGWTSTTPVAAVDRPPPPPPNPDIRFLDMTEVEALLRAVPEDVLGATEAVLYLAAAMTGLRQGELVALRWRDVDWVAGLIRVRRNYTRGEWGTPKSRRSSRAVPMADRVAAELDRHFQRTAYRADDDLVFCHPETGNPFDPSKLRKRFAAALERAGVRGVRFHDLRHTYATRMAAVGTPLRTLQEFMGHSDFRTTEIYADYAPDLSGAAALTARAFAPAQTGAESNGGRANGRPESDAVGPSAR